MRTIDKKQGKRIKTMNYKQGTRNMEWRWRIDKINHEMERAKKMCVALIIFGVALITLYKNNKNVISLVGTYI